MCCYISEEMGGCGEGRILFLNTGFGLEKGGLGETTGTKKPGLWRPTESALFPMKARTVGVVVLLLIF